MRLLQKAEAAIVSAIEIYNKPYFRYREETFAVLAVNAWELLLKAKLLATNDNDPKCLWVYERRKKKTGTLTKKQYKKRSRSGNIQTLSLGHTILALEKKDIPIEPGVKRNLLALIEVRDNAVHYLNAGPHLGKQVLELGVASVANFLCLSKAWFSHDLSHHHFYLMPIGFIAPPKDSQAIVASAEEANLVRYLAALIKADDIDPASPFQVALTVNLRLKRSLKDAPMTVSISDDPDAVAVQLSEEDVRDRFPWDYAELTQRLRDRYKDFKVTNMYHEARKALSESPALCRTRLLDPGNPKSQRKNFFSPNIVLKFDAHFTKK
jgi:hypothetical protein